MLGSRLDHVLTHLAARTGVRREVATLATRRVATPGGAVRLFDTGSQRSCVVIVPDGPNVIEHCVPLISLMAVRHRVVCFDLPGFGHSLPSRGYGHSLDEGASVVLAVLDALSIDRATLAFSCANGFYALRVAQRAPQRVHALVLSQTPSLVAMHAWARRVVPGPLHLPLVGQAAGWLMRQKAAGGWYRLALPAGRDAGPMRTTALAALSAGGCFCLAGVVQGLQREAVHSLRGVTVPCTVVWGPRDRSHSRTEPHSLESLVPHARVVTFEDCGHFPDLEASERFAALVDEAAATREVR